MNKRELIKASLLAGASTAAALPLGKIFHRLHLIGEGGYEHHLKEQDRITATRLMDRYNIPTIDDASDIYQRMLSERAKYYAGGALTGSIFRTACNEFEPAETRRKFLNRAVNVFGGSGAAEIATIPATAVMGMLQDSPLTKPETLIEEYGLSPRDAVEFSSDYSKMLTDGAGTGGVFMNFLQEILFPAPEVEAKAPEALAHDNGVS